MLMNSKDCNIPILPTVGDPELMIDSKDSFVSLTDSVTESTSCSNNYKAEESVSAIDNKCKLTKPEDFPSNMSANNNQCKPTKSTDFPPGISVNMDDYEWFPKHFRFIVVCCLPHCPRPGIFGTRCYTGPPRINQKRLPDFIRELDSELRALSLPILPTSVDCSQFQLSRLIPVATTQQRIQFSSIKRFASLDDVYVFSPNKFGWKALMTFLWSSKKYSRLCNNTREHFCNYHAGEKFPVMCELKSVPCLETSLERYMAEHPTSRKYLENRAHFSQVYLLNPECRNFRKKNGGNGTQPQRSGWIVVPDYQCLHKE